MSAAEGLPPESLKSFVESLLSCAYEHSDHTSATFEVDEDSLADLHLDIGHRFPELFVKNDGSKRENVGLPITAFVGVTRIEYTDLVARYQGLGFNNVFTAPERANLDLLSDGSAYGIGLDIQYQELTIKITRNSSMPGLRLNRPVLAEGENDVFLDHSIFLTRSGAEEDFANLLTTYTGDQLTSI